MEQPIRPKKANFLFNSDNIDKICDYMHLEPNNFTLNILKEVLLFPGFKKSYNSFLLLLRLLNKKESNSNYFSSLFSILKLRLVHI